MILNGNVKEVQDVYERFYYNQDTLTDMIDKIISDREQKIEKYGPRGYKYFMMKNDEDSSDKKGFWQKARIV